MISIIICSRSSDIPMELKQNIADTIGVEYEWVVIDNSANKYSIFSAYNEGVRLAKGDMLCFMHEDIIFHTEMWGKKVYAHFKDNDRMGLLGVIGGHCMLDLPTSWWTVPITSGQVIQDTLEGSEYEKLWDYKGEDSLSKEVVLVDGLWFCVPQKLFSEIRFDEDTFSNFHCYDSDICMQVIDKGFQVRVGYDIVIEHKSLGDTSEIYYEQRERFFTKWRCRFPMVKGVDLSKTEMDTLYKMAEIVEEYREANYKVNKELKNIRRSHAYRVGKRIMKPFSWMRKALKK